MGISHLTAKFLTEMSHEAVHLAEQGPGKLQDGEILEKARAESRILLTHDLEFASLMAAGGTRQPSVITFRLRDMRPANVNRYLQQLLVEHRRSLQEGAILSVSESRVRVRTLPIKG